MPKGQGFGDPTATRGEDSVQHYRHLGSLLATWIFAYTGLLQGKDHHRYMTIGLQKSSRDTKELIIINLKNEQNNR